MDHVAFKDARRKLGLSVNQMACMLGVQPLQIRRMELSPGKTTYRAVQGPTARLMAAYLDGYRPRDWPTGASS
jgi:transcriptional regulator with XRE-family HTH domain